VPVNWTDVALPEPYAIVGKGQVRVLAARMLYWNISRDENSLSPRRFPSCKAPPGRWHRGQAILLPNIPTFDCVIAL
jgi:hypothetical protein